MSDKYTEVRKVVDSLYYVIYPNTRTDIPSFFYERIEKEYDKWIDEGSSLTLYTYCYNQVFDKDYKIGDEVFAIVNSTMAKTKIIRLYDNHVGVYSGDFIPCEKAYHEIARTKEDLDKYTKIKDMCVNADRWLNGK